LAEASKEVILLLGLGAGFLLGLLSLILAWGLGGIRKSAPTKRLVPSSAARSGSSGGFDFMSVLRPRIERFLYGDFAVDDLNRIFLFLRERSYGRQTVHEIGNFVAHFGERDRGVATDLAANFFKLLRFMVPLMNKTDPRTNKINLDPNVLVASFKTIDMEYIRQQIKLKPRVARKVFDSLMKKAKSVVGTHNRVELDARESDLYRLLVSSFTVRAAFDDALLNKEFGECLEKNRLLLTDEMDALKKKSNLVTLFALHCMHQSTLKLDDGSIANLDLHYHNQGQLLTIRASSPCPTPTTPTLHIARSIFDTSLPAKDWCDPGILFDDNQKNVDFPIEIGPDLKLRRIGPTPIP
jgi:hypothetical protein